MICERSMIRLNIPNKGNESGKSKKVIYHCQAKKEKKRQRMIYKGLHRQPKSEQ